MKDRSVAHGTVSISMRLYDRASLSVNVRLHGSHRHDLIDGC